MGYQDRSGRLSSARPQDQSDAACGIYRNEHGQRVGSLSMATRRAMKLDDDDGGNLSLSPRSTSVPRR